MSRILAVGTATLDIISVVRVYPRENDEIRATGQHRRGGGNARNTLVILAQLGHQCAWAGMLADDSDGRWLRAEMAGRGIDLDWAIVKPHSHTPTSSIIVSQTGGSRTIVHYRDLVEFDADYFRRIDLDSFDWLHFEGRNIAETRKMLRHAGQVCPDIPRSVEIEKPRPDIDCLFEDAHLLLFSQSFALARGYGSAKVLLNDMRPFAPGADLVCSWGDDGAYALDRYGIFSHSPPHTPPAVVDTLGAGDTFNAGVIHGRLLSAALSTAVKDACCLAGRKCAQSGLDFIT